MATNKSREFKTIKYTNKSTRILDSGIANWLKPEYKSLGLKSMYGTGKSTMIKKILTDTTTFQKVLIVTHSPSIAAKYFKSFIGFNLSINNIFTSNKLICLIDHIHKVPITTEYDLIIIEEAISLFEHIGLPEHPNKQYVSLHNLLKLSKKIIACDEDYDIFANSVVTFFGKSIVMENTYRHNSKNITCIKYDCTFEASMIKDLNSKKNIHLTCMNENVAKQYEKKFAKYNPLICSKVEDLINLEDKWLKHQLVIVTPIVGPCTLFKKKHFYKLYIVLDDNNVSPRIMLRMIQNVRKVETSDVIILTGNIDS
jgi:hypothetical protein